jgi:hypothetical protein
MPEVTVTPAEGGAFAVTVRDGGRERNHLVTVPAEPATEGLPPADPRRLVEESFAFLLERESASSILAEFDLTVIGRYFPEYPNELTRRLSG